MKPPIHFAHANGFPPGCYKQLLAAISSDRAVFCLPFRPLDERSEPTSVQTWDDLADDLIHFLETQVKRPVVGIGHSLGGIVTLLAADRRPDLFHSLVLLDPVFLSRRIYLLKQITPHRFREHLVPLARISRKRRNEWPSFGEARFHLREKRVFSKITDDVFEDMLEAMLIRNEDGQVRLAFSRKWESRIYTTVTSPWKALERVSLPLLIIRGEESNTITPKIWERMKAIHPKGHFKQVAGAGHLFPLEKPEITAQWVNTFFRGLD